MPDNEDVIKLTCANPNCNYSWEYKGQNPFYATCPRCLNKVKIRGEDGRRDN